MGEALVNITVTVPNGTTNYGDQHILCSPASWANILSFIFGNYVAHAASTITLPGEKPKVIVITVILALIFPGSGIRRGLDAIVSHARTGATSLEQAARAGALCMVVRNKDWRPRQGDIVNDVIIKRRDLRQSTGGNSDRFEIQVYRAPSADYRWRWYWYYFETFKPTVITDRNIHGIHQDPVDGYSLVHVPRDAKVSPTKGTAEFNVSNSWNVAQVIAAIFQLLFSITTLYKTSRVELQHYGYASFGLTVIPYALMSLVNLIGLVANPTYSHLYLVTSDVMEEAERRGERPAMFDGVVGKLDIDEACQPYADLQFGDSGSCLFKSMPDRATDMANTGQGASQPPVRNAPIVPTEEDLERGSVLDQSRKGPLQATFRCPAFQKDDQVVTPRYHGSDTYPDERILEVYWNEPGTETANRQDLRKALEDMDNDANILWVPSCPKINKTRGLPYTLRRTPDSSPHGLQAVPKKPFYTRSPPNPALPDSIIYCWCWFVGSLSIVVVAALTKFERGGSTTEERVVLSLWLVFGIWFGPIYFSITTSLGPGKYPSFFLSIATYMVPAVYGFVLVIMMLKQFGNCIELY